MGPVRSTDGMVTVAGVRYRLEDAEARGLLALVGDAEPEPEPGVTEPEEPEGDDGEAAEPEPEPDGDGDGKKATAPANKWRRTANKAK